MGAVAGLGAIEVYRHVLADKVDRWRGRALLALEEPESGDESLPKDAVEGDPLTGARDELDMLPGRAPS